VDLTQAVSEASNTKCAPDGTIARVGLTEDSVLVLYVGALVDGTGYDLVYYEFWGETKGPGNTPGILMDPVRIEVAQADTSGRPLPASWTTVFYWGDGQVDSNTSLPDKYTIDGEIANDPILAVDLYAGADLNENDAIDTEDGSGIAIDIGQNNGVPWPFVRITSPLAGTVDTGEAAEVDAIEALIATNGISD